MMDAAAEDDGGAATAAPATADDPEKKDSRGRFPVPPEAWHPARLARDLRQAHRLVRALDAEKGVEPNPLGQAAEDDDDALRAVLDAADPTDAAKTNKHAPTATTDEKKDADDAAAEDDAMGEAAPARGRTRTAATAPAASPRTSSRRCSTRVYFTSGARTAWTTTPRRSSPSTST